jgi:hypothetical protein
MNESLNTLQSLTAQVFAAMTAEDWSLAASLQQKREQLIKICVPQLQLSLSSDELRKQLAEMQVLDTQIEASLQAHQAQLDQATQRKAKTEKALKHYLHQSRQK